MKLNTNFRRWRWVVKLKANRARKQRYKAMSVLKITNSDLFAIRMMRRIDGDDVLVRRNGSMVVQPQSATEEI